MINLRLTSIIHLLLFTSMCSQAALYASESLTHGIKVIIYSDGTLSEIFKFTKKELKEDLRKLKIKFEEKGKKGSLIADLSNGLDKYVIKKKPDLVILCTPLGDLYYSKKKGLKKNASSEEVFTGMVSIVQTLQNHGITVAVATPALAGEDLSSDNDINKALDRLANDLRAYCKNENITCCDYRKSAVTYLHKNNSNKKYKGILSKNGVQINKNGAKILTPQLKKCLGLSASGIDGPLVESDRVVFFSGDGSQWAGRHLGDMTSRIQERINATFPDFNKLVMPSCKIYYLKDRLFHKTDNTGKVIGQKARVSFIQLTTRAYDAEIYNTKFDFVCQKITDFCTQVGAGLSTADTFITTEPIADLDAKDPLRIVLTKINDHIKKTARDNGMRVLDLNAMLEEALLENPEFPLWRTKKSPYYHSDFFALVENKMCSIIGVK